MSAIGAMVIHVPKGAVKASWKRGGATTARQRAFWDVRGDVPLRPRPRNARAAAPLRLTTRDAAVSRVCAGSSQTWGGPEDCCLSRIAIVRRLSGTALARRPKQQPGPSPGLVLLSREKQSGGLTDEGDQFGRQGE
jgi:hypothetical protein